MIFNSTVVVFGKFYIFFLLLPLRMRGLKRGLLALTATAALLAGCGGQQSLPSQSPSCQHVPLEENIAVQEWRHLGGSPSLDDAVALYGYDCTLSGPLKGYSLYGIPQDEKDAEWLRLIKDLMDQDELSEDTARKALVWFATEVQDNPALRESKWSMETTVYDAVVSAVNTFHLAKERGLIPPDQKLFLRDLTATWFPLSFASFADTTPFPPFYGRTAEGFIALGSPSLPALTKENKTFFAFLPLSPDSDPRKATDAEMPGQGYDYSFSTPGPSPTADGPRLYYPLTIPAKVTWVSSYPSPYVPDTTEYSIVFTLKDLPRKIAPIPDLYFSIGHIVVPPSEEPSPFLREGAIIPPLSVRPDGRLENLTYLNRTLVDGAGLIVFDWIITSKKYPVGYSLADRGMDAFVIDPNNPRAYDWSSPFFGAPPQSFFSLDPRLRGIPRFNTERNAWDLLYPFLAPPAYVSRNNTGQLEAFPPSNPDITITLPPGVMPW